MCRDVLDDIRDVMKVLCFEDRIVAENASVVGLAAVLSGKLSGFVGHVGTVITGHNLDMNLFNRIMAGQDVKIGALALKGETYGT